MHSSWNAKLMEKGYPDRCLTCSHLSLSLPWLTFQNLRNHGQTDDVLTVSPGNSEKNPLMPTLYVQGGEEFFLCDGEEGVDEGSQTACAH